MATFSSQTMARGPYPQTAVSMPPISSVPPGTFMPGTKVQVGNHRVVIDRYLSEGGFAHVYVVTLPKPVDGQEKAVLKRVAVPDKEHLANMRTEVETMKRLRGHKYIVKYIDSHASSLKNGGYEVFLLMEFCQGGGLIDFMNTRLQNRLTEPEILKIFTDIAEGVACMHYLRPPLLHRDLKIENVLISTWGKERIYKVCDFGSAAPPRPAATSTTEGRLIEEDIQKHTTLQYRSPEMIDVYRKQPIDEKSDIWALGCFLYKLCYYTTPFEEVGQTAILNASFKYPGHPKFSDQLKLLIATMLREQPSQRPNIYQVLQKACQLDGRELEIKDVYANRTDSEKRRTEVLPEPSSSESRAGATLAPPKKDPVQSIPDISPMRRGRPSAPTSHHNSAKPSPSPLRMLESSDPFAQLDGNQPLKGDELSAKFPTLDQFALITDKGSRFSFQSESTTTSKNVDLNTRVVNALADEAFVKSPPPDSGDTSVSKKSDISRASTIPPRPKPLNMVSGKSAAAASTVSKKPATVSTSTITSPPSQSTTLPPVSDKPIWRVPNTERSSSAGPARKPDHVPRPAIKTAGSGSRLANLLKQDASQSQDGRENNSKPSSSRPLTEDGRPVLSEFESDNTLSRSRSLNIRKRPVSVNIGAGPTHIKDREINKMHYEPPVKESGLRLSENAIVESDTNIASDIDFLKAKEEEEKEKTKHLKRGSSRSRQGKRASLPSIALAGTKNILQGRFGEAFKKFESGDDSNREYEDADLQRDVSTRSISAAAQDHLYKDRDAVDEVEDLSPEMRRELEKRQLEAEERRVAQGAADYRSRTASGPGRPPVPSGKAAAIRNRVQSLLQESGKPVSKTATGYGQYTQTQEEPLPVSQSEGKNQNESINAQQQANKVTVSHQESRSISAPASQVNLTRLQRPIAPPKPKVLQTPRAETMPLPASDETPHATPTGAGDDWEEQFSKRYPSLSHLEMVETEIGNDTLSQRLSVKEI